MLRRLICHREERGDLAFQRWQTDKNEIASQARNDRTRAALATPKGGSDTKNRATLAMTRNTVARDVAISIVRNWPGRKERLLRRLAMTILLSKHPLGVARNVAISLVRGWPSRKERLLRRLAMTILLSKHPLGVARSVAISVVRGWPGRKERLPRCARNDRTRAALATPQGGFDKTEA